MIRHRSNNSGFTLVELMVGLVVGLLISGAAAAIFILTRNTSRYGDALARYQEGFRYASQVMARDIRMAGYFGCNAGVAPTNLASGTNEETSFTQAVQDYDKATAISGALAGRVSGTEALRIQLGSEQALRLDTAMSAKNSELSIPADSGFADGDYAVVSDCTTSAAFKITAATASGTHTTLSHTKDTNTSDELPKKFDTSAEVYGLETRYYYVAQDGNRRVLKRRILHGSTVEEQEVADGIMDLHFLYGIDTDGDTQVNQYVNAASVTDWNKVSAVRFCFVSRSDNDHLSTGFQKYYGCDGAEKTAADRRLYAPVFMTVSLRNRTN